jgi:RND family efflux transporter MFP subunit
MRLARTASGYLAAAALLVLGGCNADEAPANQTIEGPVVQIVEVQPQLAAGAIRASGMIGYKREPQLAFAAPGVVANIAVDAGDVVRRGQRLATLRRTSAGSDANEAALASANAERDLQRTQALFDQGFVSQARLDDARLASERARASSVLTAPANGVILRRNAEVSQTVAAGAPIFVFGETASGLVVRAPVASADASRIQVGDAAIVRIAGAAPHEGRVTRVGAKGNEGTGAFEVEIEIAEVGALRSGTVAEVEVAASGAATAAPVIIVPTLSLLDARADQGVVFVVDAEGIARRRTVRTAGVTQEGVLVVEGLNAGDRVIAAGAAYVRDGESVRITAGS